MGSSMSRRKTRSSPAQSFFASHGSCQRAFRLLSTIPEGQCRKGYAMNLVVERRSGVRSVVDFAQCKFQRREGSRPNHVSPFLPHLIENGLKMGAVAHPHSSI